MCDADITHLCKWGMGEATTYNTNKQFPLPLSRGEDQRVVADIVWVMCVDVVAGVVSVACSEVGGAASVDPCPAFDVDDAFEVGVVDAGLLVVSLIASSVVDEECVEPLVVTTVSVWVVELYVSDDVSWFGVVWVGPSGEVAGPGVVCCTELDWIPVDVEVNSEIVVMKRMTYLYIKYEDYTQNVFFTRIIRGLKDFFIINDL